MTLQLPLDLSLSQGRYFKNYFAGKNDPLVQQLTQAIAQGSEQFVYLCGNPGVGKTHLLLAACHYMGQLARPVSFICLQQHKEYGPAILEDMQAVDLLCIDNVHAVAGDDRWERALFNLYNVLRDSGVPLIVSAKFVPNASAFNLQDLVSRFNWGLTIKLQELADEDKIKAMQLRADDKGIELSVEVAQYMFKRCPRDMHALFELLDRLDYQSLASQRKLTVPFVKSVIEDKGAR